jgi:hypothetical protein
VLGCPECQRARSEIVRLGLRPCITILRCGNRRAALLLRVHRRVPAKVITWSGLVPDLLVCGAVTNSTCKIACGALSLRCSHGSFSASETFRNGQPSAVAVDVIDFMNALRIEKAVLAGFDWRRRRLGVAVAVVDQPGRQRNRRIRQSVERLRARAVLDRGL